MNPCVVQSTLENFDEIRCEAKREFFKIDCTSDRTEIRELYEIMVRQVWDSCEWDESNYQYLPVVNKVPLAVNKMPISEVRSNRLKTGLKTQVQEKSTNQLDWFLEHIRDIVIEHDGMWIAIVCNEVVAFAPTAKELWQTVKDKKIKKPFIAQASLKKWGIDE